VRLSFGGDTGVAISVSWADSKTLTREFFNAKPNSIKTMNFDCGYVAADTEQDATQEDVVPLTLKPGADLDGVVFGAADFQETTVASMAGRHNIELVEIGYGSGRSTKKLFAHSVGASNCVLCRTGRVRLPHGL